MATVTNLDPRCDPESAKRLASGFWSHQYDHFGDIETWSCDKRKLNDALVAKMRDPEFSYNFNNNPRRLLDGLWGEGTYEAFRHSSNDRVNIRLNPFLRENQMALYTGTSTNTNTITTTTAGTSGYYYGYDQRMYIRDELDAQMRREVQNAIAKEGKKLSSYKFRKKLVKNLPFVNSSDGLVKTLQREFDHWAGDQMKVLYG